MLKTGGFISENFTLVSGGLNMAPWVAQPMGVHFSAYTHWAICSATKWQCGNSFAKILGILGLQFNSH